MNAAPLNRIGRRIFDTRAYMNAQQSEVLGPVNRYYTGLAVGRDPSPEECWKHWIASKAGDQFRATQTRRFWIEVSCEE